MPNFILRQYVAAESLERYLGDPSDASNTFSFDKSVALDELELYPEDSCALLDRWNFSAYYVPAKWGGRQQSFEEFVALLRSVARRDLTVAIAHGKTYLGAVAVWVGGSDELQERLARIIANGSQVALGLTEKCHGSDLLSGDVHAERVTGGYALSGEKWLVNNATRGAALTVFARTAVEGGPRGFSLLFAEKNGGQNLTYTHLLKIKTQGIRGADISGICFRSHFVPEDALVGVPGAGLEIMLKAFQLTRTVIAGLSLGAADTALRCVMDFALSRRLYGGTLIAIPHARRLIATAFIDALVCDCMATAIARSVHVLPEQLGFLSAVAKYFVPKTVEALIGDLSTVLGARHYLRGGHYSGVFQKILRDNAILSLFDGSTAVNLNSIAAQLGQPAGRRESLSAADAERVRTRLATIFSLDETLPEFDATRLTLRARGSDTIMQGLEMSLSGPTSPATGTYVAPDVLSIIHRLKLKVLEEADNQVSWLRSSAGKGGNLNHRSVEAFEQAERYCELLAAGCCVQMWEHNRGSGLGAYFDSGEWVALGLSRLLARMGSKSEGQRAAWERYEAGAVKEMERRLREGLSFSIVPLRFAKN